MRRNSEQQRSRAGDRHSLATNLIAASHECLQAASAKHSRQSPTRKWQKTFTCPRSKDELFKGERLQRLRRRNPRAQCKGLSGNISVHHLTPAEQRRSRSLEPRDRANLRWISAGCFESRSPYLPT